MFMLCYCNGALARDSVRDGLNSCGKETGWERFDKTVLNTPTAGKSNPMDAAKIGIYFPIPEIIPDVRAGTWRFNYKDGLGTETH